MQSGRPQRAPGSFSPLPGSVSSSSAAAAAAAASGNGRDSQPHLQRPSSQYPNRPQIRRIESSSSDDTTSQLSISKVRSPQSPIGAISPSYTNFTSHPNSSVSSLQTGNLTNFSRPSRPTQNSDGASVRTSSPLTLPPTRGPPGAQHMRKHSQTQGLFDSTLPSTSSLNISQSNMAQPSSPTSGLSASQIAAQAAMQHQNINQHQQHSRHRSQTVPFPGSEAADSLRRPATRPLQPPTDTSRRPLSPPMLSLTEASVPREGPMNHGYHNGLLGTHSQAATAAANVVFPRSSPNTSPSLPSPEYQPPAPPFLPPLAMPEKPIKPEKSKVKLFSRPKKIDTKGESKEKPLPSPGKIGSALASLQRANFSTASLVENSSMYNLANSSAATIRPIDNTMERENKEKEKKLHFLSRQKNKLSNKDDYHLPLSSAASNSRPVDPNAPSSLYNFELPPSPGPNTTSFTKSKSGLDLRHGGRALREKRKEERLGMAQDNESAFTLSGMPSSSEWPGTGSFGASLTQTQSNLTLNSHFDPSIDGAKYGLSSNLTLDDAWPYLKAKLLVIFEGEDLRLPIEDFNRVVTMHIQYCIQRRSPHIVIEDLRELLSTGFSSLDHTLRKIPEDRLIPSLVDVWMATFTNILPYMQAVFLPLDLEFWGVGPLLSPETAREFWGGIVNSGTSEEKDVGSVLDVRRLVLLAYRDALILPRYERLKTIFSRLSLEHLPSSLATLALASPPLLSGAGSSGVGHDALTSSSPRDISIDAIRPGTAMSLDPSLASYNSSSSTLLGDNASMPSSAPRSRAISNVSYGSGVSDGNSSGLLRPFAPGRTRADSDRDRDRDAETGSKQLTDMVGRMLQCMSVLAGVGADPFARLGSGAEGEDRDEGSKKVAELGKLLKLNWLGRGRTGRNRRGIVGGRVKRPPVPGFNDLAPESTGRHARGLSSASAGASGAGPGIGLGLKEGLVMAQYATAK